MQSEFKRNNFRVAIIGGSRGIGRAIAERFAAQGASLAVAARHVEPLRALMSELTDAGAHIHIGPCDVTDAASTAAFLSGAADDLGGLDTLVNCASSFSSADDEESWRAAFDTDLMGSVRALNAALPYLKRSPHASVVNFSSVGARQAPPDRLPYAAMKAAVEQFTAGAAVRHARDDIRVNCIVVGSTDFPGGVWDRIRQTDFATYEATRKRIPLGGFASPETIADAVLFLASTRSRWITGQCIVVDGGQTARGGR